MVIEQSIRRSHYGLATPSRIPSNANARLNIVFVGLNPLLQAQQVIGRKRQPLGRRELRRNFHVVAQAVIQRDGWTDPPRILPEHSDGNILERVAGTANSLHEVSRKSGAVRLHRRQVREIGQASRVGIHKPQAGGPERSEVIYATIVHGERRSERQIVKIPSELHVVSPHRPRVVVGELVALLDALNEGVRFAAEIRIAGNVYRWVGAARNLRIVEIGKSAAGILKAEFIDLVVADGPGILKHSGYVAVRLLRSARVRVLPEGLILAADFDTGDRAGADVGAERQTMVRPQIVVEAERVEACSFKDGEVSHLRGQGLERSRNEATSRRSATGGKACETWKS